MYSYYKYNAQADSVKLIKKIFDKVIKGACKSFFKKNFHRIFAAGFLDFAWISKTRFQDFLMVVGFAKFLPFS